MDNSTSATDPLLYLDTFNAMEFAQTYKRQSFELLAVKEGNWVLDVGCGTGDDVRTLAEFVGQTGKVVGIDKNKEAI